MTGAIAKRAAAEPVIGNWSGWRSNSTLVGDIEDAFTNETGRRLLSRAAVSEINRAAVGGAGDLLQTGSFRACDVAYLFVDPHRRGAEAGQRARRRLPCGALPRGARFSWR
jgi:hypothetical protein